MGATGVLLVLFLLLHLAVNLTSLISREAYESAWRLMNGHVLPRVIMPVLALGFLLHMIYGVVITVRNTKRQKIGHEGNHSWNTFKSLLSLGLIVVGLLLLHLSQFWAKIQLHGGSPYDIVKTLFYNSFYQAIYVMWIIALYFHLSRGFWAMFQGVNTSNAKLVARLKTASQVFSFLIAGGFLLILVYFYLGFGYK